VKIQKQNELKATKFKKQR